MRSPMLADIEEDGDFAHAAKILPARQRMSKDLKLTATGMSREEARDLVDWYYQMQDNRIRAEGQIRSLGEEKPHAILDWLADQDRGLETQVKSALDYYSAASPLGVWARAQKGIGPVIAAGLLAHIDLEIAKTAGAIWRYAGLDPTVKWEKGQKRPWNASLKTLCWKIGESFVKVSGSEDAFYGQLYKERKVLEIERNERGDNKLAADEILKAKKFRGDTIAKKRLEAGYLPDAQVHARAKRYAVKIFLSHYHMMGYRLILGREAPVSFPIAHQGHTHIILPPAQDE
jgi:hypothetical protein